MNYDFKKCSGCSCHRKYPEEYLNDRGRILKTCRVCRVKGKKKYNKTLEKAGKSRVRQGGSLGNSEIFQRTKWIDNIEYPDSEPDTGYDTKPYIGYNPPAATGDTKPYKGYINSCFNVKNNKTEKLKKEDETETETESESEEVEEVEEEEEETLQLPTTQEEVKIYLEERLLNRDSRGNYYDKSGQMVLSKSDYYLLPLNAKDKIKQLKEKENKKIKEQLKVEGLPIPKTKEQVLNYANKKLLKRDLYGNFHDRCGRIIISKFDYLLLPKDELTIKAALEKEEKIKKRKENKEKREAAKLPALRVPKSKSQVRLWQMMEILTLDALGNYKDKFGRQVLSKSDYYILPLDDEIKKSKLNFDVVRD